MPHWDLPWANAEANNDDEGPGMWDGFLQNPLLVKTWRALFYGPAAALKNTNDGTARGQEDGVTIGSII